MSNGLSDLLGLLAPRFGQPVLSTDKAKIDGLFAYYLRDFFDNPFQCNGIDVKVKSELYRNHVADGLPDFYCGYHEKFVHLLTREVSGKKVVHSKKRIFKENRANRIHWIKPILQNWQDNRITYFHFLESDGSINEYFWYKAKDYIVILEKVTPDYYLITAFCIDISNRAYFENKYAARCGP